MRTRTTGRRGVFPFFRKRPRSEGSLSNSSPRRLFLEPLEERTLLDGFGVLDGTVLEGLDLSDTSQPGFSAAFGMVSAPMTVREMELDIYGSVGMHDEVPVHADNFNMPVPDQPNGYDQVMGYTSPGASVVTLNGPLLLSFPTGYQPTLGDEFMLYFAHAFNPFMGEVPKAEFAYTDDFMAALPGLIAGLPELADPSWFYEANTGAEVFSIGVQVPEPGTLVLLISGGLGLLACAWRKRCCH